MNDLFYRNPRLLFLVLGVVIAMAASAINQISRQEDPTITNIFATIVTPFPGAEPSRVEALVTENIEQRLREIPEIDEIKSTSRTGVSVIAVKLSLYLKKDRIENVWSEIRDALGDASKSFPQGIADPVLDTDRAGTFTTISAIVMRDGYTPNPLIQQRYAELLQDRLREVKNTKLVRLWGHQQEEVQVTLDRAKLAASGLSFDAVSSAITNADTKVRAGNLNSISQNLLVELSGEIRDLQRIRNIPLVTDQYGGTLHIGDIASVKRTIRRPSTQLAFADGKPAILIGARMEDDRQVDVWTRDIRAVMEGFRASLPDGLELRLVFDQNVYTKHRFQSLGLNLGIGVGLVVLVLFVTLGWRAAAVVATIIPLATLISISIMNFVGLPIQQMSVTGLIVALGLLVDAAIVMSDEIKRRLEDGMQAVKAVGESVNRLWAPLLASTITTVLAFMPMALLPGPAGDFVGSIAWSVIIMLVVSFVLAITITPAIAGRFLNNGSGRGSMLSSGIRLPRIEKLFDKLLHLSLRHKALSITGALVLPLMGFAAFPTLTAQFFPGVDRDQFYIQVAQPGGTSIEASQKLALKIDTYLRQQTDIKKITWVVGESAPAFYYNMQMNQDGIPAFAEALVTTTSPKATGKLIPQLQIDLDQKFPQARILVQGLVQGPPVDAPVELRLVGPDLDTLRTLGMDIRRVMTRVPDITHSRANLIGADPKIKFNLDEEKVRLAGLTLGEVARQIETALNGALGGSLIEATEEMPVRVRLSRGNRNSFDALRSLIIMPQGASSLVANNVFPGIPLTALGSLDLVPSDSPISRRNGERVNTIQGFVVLGVLPEEALKKVQAELAKSPVVLPRGYRMELGGDADARQETAANMAKSAGMVIILTIITIFLTYWSYRLSIITFLVAGLSMGLSLLALAIFQHPFGITALIGAIGSIGVSVNAAIIILTALQEDEAAMAGEISAIVRVVSRSARHIISTTITTVGGFIPLILAGGAFWPPFAMAIAGGVSLSVVLAFFFTPSMFALLMRPKHKMVASSEQKSEANPEFQAKPLMLATDQQQAAG